MINKLYIIIVLFFIGIPTSNGADLKKMAFGTSKSSMELPYTMGETTTAIQSSVNERVKFRNCSAHAKAVLTLEICFSLTIAILIAGSSFWKASYIGSFLLLLLFTGAFVYYNISINDCLLTYGGEPQEITKIWNVKNGLFYVFGVFLTFCWGTSIQKQKGGKNGLKRRDKIILIFLLLLFSGYTIVYMLL